MREEGMEGVYAAIGKTSVIPWLSLHYNPQELKRCWRWWSNPMMLPLRKAATEWGAHSASKCLCPQWVCVRGGLAASRQAAATVSFHAMGAAASIRRSISALSLRSITINLTDFLWMINGSRLQQTREEKNDPCVRPVPTGPKWLVDILDQSEPDNKSCVWSLHMTLDLWLCVIL